ncbi:WS/DGAT/MGAT family O-acyltransferase [Actinosynnema sp. CA-248983]
MDRMSAVDAGFYFAEDPDVPMHVGSVLVFEGPAPSYGDVVRLFAGKLGEVPRYRQRVRASPFHVGRPVWVDDEHFRLLHHVRRAVVPAPGADDQLRDVAGRLFERGLDLGRPLWEAWFVEGLEGGRWAVVCKVHHCLVDGVAGMGLMQVLLDWRADAPVPVAAPWTPRPAPSVAELVMDGVLTPLASLSRIPRVGAEVAGHGRSVLRSLPGTARRLVVPTPGSLNGPVGRRRRWVWAKAGLPEIKGIREVAGGTVNDVILAAVTAGFRALLAKRDELRADQVVRTLVPVSTRSSAERGVLTNRVGAVLVNLPVGEPDPLRRLADVREQMDGLKRSGQAVVADVVTGLGELASGAVLAWASRAVMRVPQRVLQTVVTNVPGPRVPLHMLGRRLAEVRPYVPVAGNVRVSVGVFSYLDQVVFGITGDFDGVPEVRVLAEGVREGFDELVAATA